MAVAPAGGMGHGDLRRGVDAPLTAPGSANPPVRVGVGLMIGGAVLGLASLLERHVLGTLLGVSSVVAGAFLQDQQFRHVQTVSRGIAVVALVLGVRSARDSVAGGSPWALHSPRR
ncbi:MAG: hypothetical protein R2710_28845 [Acidimicrobiales bacterium]